MTRRRVIGQEHCHLAGPASPAFVSRPPAGLDHRAPTFLARVSTSARLRPGFPQLEMSPCARPRLQRSSEPEVMAMHAKDMLGKSGEQAAAEYLESCGLRILDRNWRCSG